MNKLIIYTSFICRIWKNLKASMKSKYSYLIHLDKNFNHLFLLIIRNITNIYHIIFLFFLSFLSYYLIISTPHAFASNSLFTSKYFSNNSKYRKLPHNYFVRNNPILKTYGPLILDINNIYFGSNIIFIPMLNNDYKPIFLAINCKERLFNVKGNQNFTGWFPPFFYFELSILNDFCFS